MVSMCVHMQLLILTVNALDNHTSVIKYVMVLVVKTSQESFVKVFNLKVHMVRTIGNGTILQPCMSWTLPVLSQNTAM